MSSFIETPDWSKLPRPVDDGATRHLVGMRMPDLVAPATSGEAVNFAKLKGRVVVYAYPRTGRPGVPNPDGWDAIPGARGCTPQTCAFRDHYRELQSFGITDVFGVSTQDSAYQREAAERLHLPFALLSDAELKLTRALNLPTFSVEGMTLLKRFSLIIEGGVIRRVFYPVFPPDANATEVLNWLRNNRA